MFNNRELNETEEQKHSRDNVKSTDKLNHRRANHTDYERKRAKKTLSNYKLKLCNLINETLKLDWKRIYRCNKLKQRMPRQEPLVEINPSQLNNFKFIDFRERAFFGHPESWWFTKSSLQKKEQIKFHFNMKYCKLKNHGCTGIPVDGEMSTFSLLSRELWPCLWNPQMSEQPDTKTSIPPAS